MAVIYLRPLRWRIALLVAASLVAAALVAWSHHRHTEVKQQHAREHRMLAETRAKLARAHEDEREIRARIHRYQEIIAQGHGLPERRLEWVEILDEIREERRLLSLDYEIAPQRLQDEHAPEADAYRFLLSPMRLEMTLLHENDLLGLLADLQSRTQAIIGVRQCRIERTGNAPSAGALKAACEIDWITLQGIS